LPPAAENQRDAGASERAAIDSLRAGSATAAEPNNAQPRGERRVAPALASQEAQLEAARAEVRSLAAALDQANRRLADMERSLARHPSAPAALPVFPGNDPTAPPLPSSNGFPS